MNFGELSSPLKSKGSLGCGVCSKGIIQLSLKVIGNVTIQYSAYDLVFNVRRNYASLLYCSRDLASYLLKLTNVSYPTCIWHPVCGLFHWNFIKAYGITKLESLGCHVALGLRLIYRWPSFTG